MTQLEQSILDSDCEALVNTVNCEGVMGAGLALQFKNKYPEMFESYRKACANGKVSVGKMDVWRGEKIIINFPTKIEWRCPSQLWYITDGLHHLKYVIKLMKIQSIAIPALGCGLGGLSWSVVEPLIMQILGDLTVGDNKVRIDVYPPIPIPYTLHKGKAIRHG